MVATPELPLQIDRLLIELPGGDGDTAVELVRLVARRLSGGHLNAARATLPVRVEVEATHAGDHLDALAARIAQELLSELSRAA